MKTFLQIWFLTTIYILRIRSQDVPDISKDPYVFQSDSLPVDEDGNILLRYMPSVGNGHLATNLYTDTIYANGLYNGYEGWSYRAKIPSLHASILIIDGVQNPETLYSLNIREGMFEEQMNSSDVAVLYRTYAHHYFNRVLVTEIIITRIGIGNDEITISKSNNVSDITEDINFEEPRIYNETYRISCGQTVIPETDSSGLVPVCLHWSPMPDTFTLQPSETSLREIYFISIDQNEAVSRANLDAVADLSPEELLTVHTESWSDVWENGEIIIEGDLNLQKVVAGCFYYLYSNLPSMTSYSANGLFYGLSPGGLANGRNGSDYYGHVFWDMETWMYPGILYFRPDLAKEMLSYRIHGMDPAFQRAALGNYNGTRFPWESAYTGVEVTPNICPACRDNQQHITGDIAFAARQYISATRDTDFLTSEQADTQYRGFDFIQEMAQFWYTRPSYNATKDKYEIKGKTKLQRIIHILVHTCTVVLSCRMTHRQLIEVAIFRLLSKIILYEDIDIVYLARHLESPNTLPIILTEDSCQEYQSVYLEDQQHEKHQGVMPPDEYQEEINNSVYTNLAASLSIHFARYAACLAGEDPEESVPDSWLNVAENLVFTYHREKHYHEEFEGYDDKIFKQIKQADVILIGFPFLWDMPEDVRRNDLDTYEPVTDPNGPAMTWGMYAIGWLELDELDKAEELFNRSYFPYHREPFKIWTEVQSGLGAVNFITGMGGFLQAILSGYGGLRLHVEALQFNKPSLPPNVNKMTFKNMKYLGNSVTVAFEEDIVGIEVTSEGMPLILEFSDNSTINMLPGVKYNFIPDDFKLYSSEPSNCELPRDYIDVNYDPVE